MSRGLCRTAARTSAALILASGAGLVFVTGAGAEGLPLPTPSPLPDLGSVLTTPSPSPAPDTKLLPLDLRVTVPLVKQAPRPPASPLPPVKGTPAPAPLLDALKQASVGAKSGLDQLGAATAKTPLALVNPSGAARALADVNVDANPLASACVQATGSDTALANLNLDALGTDLSTPLIQTLPGVVNACPAASGPGGGVGGVPAPGTGSDTAASAAAAAGSLVGACARITTSVAPVESTIVVLDQNLIERLTAAGLPLDQLIVKCPSNASEPGGGGTGGGAGGASGGATGQNGSSTEVSGSSQGASAFPAMASLPFTGAQVSAFLALAALLIGAGSWLVARARHGALAVRV